MTASRRSSCDGGSAISSCDGGSAISSGDSGSAISSGDGGSAISSGDGGSAIIEFIFVAVIVMIPLVYLVVAVATIQRSELAMSQAAREAGRAFATSDRQADAFGRARAALHLALRNQGLPDDGEIAFVRAGAACSSAHVVPNLTPGTQFTICVTRHVAVPAVPTILAGRGITTVGEYVVHIDDYRSTP